MSSEVFSTARVAVQRQRNIAEQLRREVERTAARINEISSSINRISRLMQERGKQVQEGDRTERVTLETISAGKGDGEASGYVRTDVEELIAAIKKREALLQVSGVVPAGEDETVTVSLGTESENMCEEQQSGYVKEAVTAEPGIVMASNREKINLADLLQKTADKRAAVYQEELLVLIAMLEAPVWSKADLEHKKRSRRAIVRIEADETMDVAEKAKKISGLQEEYAGSISRMPEGTDADGLLAQYMALLHHVGMQYTEEVAVSHLPMKIEALMGILQAKSEKEFIEQAVVEAFEKEGIYLDEVKSLPGKQVFYMEEEDNCEIVLENVESGFLMESVGVSKNGTAASDEEKEGMVASAKKVCEKYRRVVERLHDVGVIIDIDFEGVPDVQYLKVVKDENPDRIGTEDVVTVRRRRRRKKAKEISREED